jgi:hypothetical protein
LSTSRRQSAGAASIRKTPPRTAASILRHASSANSCSISVPMKKDPALWQPGYAGGNTTQTRWEAVDEAPKAGRPVRYGPLRSSARTSGRSVMMPSTP